MHGIGQQLCTRVTSSSCSHKFDAADTTGIQEKNVYSEMQNSRCGRESRMGYWAWGGGGGSLGAIMRGVSALCASVFINGSFINPGPGRECGPCPGNLSQNASGQAG